MNQTVFIRKQPAAPARPRAIAYAVALTVAALAGCTSLIPSMQRPTAPVPAQFADAGVATPGQAVAADLEWRNFFSDARLRQLIGIALNNNRDLRVAVLNIESARAQITVRAADQFPTISLSGSASRTPVTVSGRTVGVNTYSAGLAESAWELDFFGRLGSLTEAARAQFLGTEEARKAAQISLVASVASTYFNLLADEELLTLAQQTLATREDSFKLTHLKFTNGVASGLDDAQAQSLVEAARVSLSQVQRQRAQDQNALALLLGQPLPADLPAAPTLEKSQMSTELAAGLPSEVLQRRPDIRQAEQALLAANANIGAARAAFFPRITLTSSIGTASSQLAGLFKAGSWAAAVSPLLIALPIFDAGRNEANLAVAKVQREVALAQYEKAIQSAFREVSDALAGRATLGEQLRAQTAQAAADSERFRLSDLRYRNGVASYLDLLDAQRSLFATQQATIQTRLLQMQNQVALYRVLGGGYTEPGTGSR